MNFFNKYIPRKNRAAFLFLAAAGTFSHFLYDWTSSCFFALFCPVNESVWEHLKLLVFPFLFYSLWNYARIYKNQREKPYAPAYFYFRLLAVLCGMASIIMLFYTYTGIFGRNFLPFDILIFLTGILVSLYMVSYLPKHITRIPSTAVTYTAWLMLLLCFFVFTCFPPAIPLFFF